MLNLLFPFHMNKRKCNCSVARRGTIESDYRSPNNERIDIIERKAIAIVDFGLKINESALGVQRHTLFKRKYISSTIYPCKGNT